MDSALAGLRRRSKIMSFNEFITWSLDMGQQHELLGIDRVHQRARSELPSRI